MRFDRPICPECQSEDTIPIIYGLPSAELMEEAEKGDIYLGGCSVSGDDPDWHCRECGRQWRDESDED